jgi:hypothetical protein
MCLTFKTTHSKKIVLSTRVTHVPRLQTTSSAKFSFVNKDEVRASLYNHNKKNINKSEAMPHPKKPKLKKKIFIRVRHVPHPQNYKFKKI